MRTIIITLILLCNTLAHADWNDAIIEMGRQQQSWDDFHYKHVERQEMSAVRARQSSISPRYPSQRRQRPTMADCAPGNTYCQQMIRHQQNQDQFNMFD